MAAAPPVTAVALHGTDALPDDCLHRIFHYLGEKDVGSVALTCRSLAVAIDGSPLWFSRAAALFGFGTGPREHRAEGLLKCYVDRAVHANGIARYWTGQYRAACDVARKRGAGLSALEQAEGCRNFRHYNKRAVRTNLPWERDGFVPARPTAEGFPPFVGARDSNRYLIAYRGWSRLGSKRTYTANDQKVLRALEAKRKRTAEECDYFTHAMPPAKRKAMAERLQIDAPGDGGEA
jgi:hypothetical protein